MEKCQKTKVVTQDKLSRHARSHRKRNNETKEKQARTTELYFADLKES